jgi:hypothetical protein
MVLSRCIGAAQWAAAALALLSAAAFSYQTPSEEIVSVKDGGVTASVSVTQDNLDLNHQTLRVKVAARGRSAAWKFEGLSLDPEPDGPGTVEIFGTSQGRFLFVHAYSGGAHCCWSLQAFDLIRLKPLESSILSEGSIDVGKGVGGCELGAKWQPQILDPSRDIPPTAYSCFNGRRFVKAPRGGDGAGYPASNDMPSKFQ